MDGKGEAGSKKSARYGTMLSNQVLDSRKAKSNHTSICLQIHFLGYDSIRRSIVLNSKVYEHVATHFEPVGLNSNFVLRRVVQVSGIHSVSNGEQAANTFTSIYIDILSIFFS